MRIRIRAALLVATTGVVGCGSSGGSPGSDAGQDGAVDVGGADAVGGFSSTSGSSTAGQDFAAGGANGGSVGASARSKRAGRPRRSQPNERMTVRFTGWTHAGVLFESTELGGTGARHR